MKILEFPRARQAYNWDCGVSLVQAVLAYYGIDVREETVIKISGATEKGTPVSGIKSVIKKYGLDFKMGRLTVEEIKKYLNQKIPVILLVQAWSKKKNKDWEKNWSDGHYVAAVGYDAEKLYFEDPAVISRTFLTYKEFQKRWHDVDANGKKYINWGMAVFGRKPVYALLKPRHMD